MFMHFSAALAYDASSRKDDGWQVAAATIAGGKIDHDRFYTVLTTHYIVGHVLPKLGIGAHSHSDTGIPLQDALAEAMQEFGRQC